MACSKLCGPYIHKKPDLGSLEIDLFNLNRFGVKVNKGKLIWIMQGF